MDESEQAMYADAKEKLYSYAASYNDLLTIFTTYTDVDTTLLKFNYPIVNKDGSMFTMNDLEELYAKVSSA